MKKKVFILVLFLFAFYSVNATNTGKQLEVFEKYEKATIHFLDGTSIKGYGKIVKFLKVFKIKFKASESGDPYVWTSLMVKGITFHIGNENFYFEYVKVRKTTAPILLELVENGEVNMYVVVNKRFVTYGFDFDPKQGGYWETSFSYFVKKKTDKLAINFNKVINFKKTAKIFFKGCDGVINRINSKEYNIQTVPEMVYYYNDFCAEIKSK